MKTQAETDYTQQLAHTHPQLPTSMLGLREAARQRFENFGLPTRRNEAWKYTDVRAIAPAPLTPANSDVKSPEVAVEHPIEDAVQLVFVDGHYVPKISAARPNGVLMLSLEQALGSDLEAQVAAAFAHPAFAHDAMLALNTGLKTAVVVLHVSAGAQLATPINLHAIFTQKAAFYTHLVVIVEAGARVELIETRQAAAQVQCNHVVQLMLGEGAQCHYHIIQDSANITQNMRATTIAMAADTQLHMHQFAMECPLSRHSVWADVNGENTHIALSGVQLVRGNEHQDTTIVLNHMAPHTTSLENYKSVVAGQGRAVFQGKIHVAAPAQKTDAKMRANGILLNEGAEFYSKPELEIYADDVLCAHGATCGAIDDELLFYMRARGIPEIEAKALLVQAFVGDALECVENDEVRELLTQKVVVWLK